LTFEDAQLRLLAQVRNRIRNGELTERGFARVIGISQPHAHNVLKGVRKLSPQIFDSILKYFHLSLLDLVPLGELEEHLERRTRERFAEVPFLDSPIGPGMPWPRGVDRRRRFPLPFPSVVIPSHLVMASLIEDPQMSSTLAGCDIALVDTSGPARSEISPESLYVVEHNGAAVLRYMRPGVDGVYLVSDATLDTPGDWEHLRVTTRERIEAVEGRVLWIGRERDRSRPANQRGRFL
jgi:hypothetical protein